MNVTTAVKIEDLAQVLPFQDGRQAVLSKTAFNSYTSLGERRRKKVLERMAKGDVIYNGMKKNYNRQRGEAKRVFSWCPVNKWPKWATPRDDEYLFPRD